MERILIVEDEESILMALEDDLGMEGYRINSARTGTRGLELARERAYDLMILDVMLPGMDGFEVCRRLRAEGVGTPILMLTAKGQEIDRVLGLELGADDYVTKPFSPRELLARIRALLRRSRPVNSEPDALESYSFGDVAVDFRKYEATKALRPLDLTTRELELLRFLIRNRERAVGRDEVLAAVWEDPAAVYPRTVDVHVANLRKKIEDDPANPRWIVGVRGIGYRFAG